MNEKCDDKICDGQCGSYQCPQGTYNPGCGSCGWGNPGIQGFNISVLSC
eukprot:gene3038-7358_t